MHAVIAGQIEPTEAAGRVLTPAEPQLVSSISQIGKGGSGEIFKICFKHSAIEKRSHLRTPTRAIARKIKKVLSPQEKVDYIKEVKSMKDLGSEFHKNVIQYIADGEILSDSIYFIDMELCDINLDEYMNGTQNISGIHGLPAWNKEDPDLFLIVAIVQQLLSGLDFMHKKQMVHRDLDPKNVLYSATQGWWKLADFGLTSPGTTNGQHSTEMARGKNGYRAAEMMQTGGTGKSTFNQKTDIWSLGCILYDLCVGERAFRNDFDAFQYAANQKALEITFPRSVMYTHAHIPFELWIHDMINFDPKLRPTPADLGKRFWQLLLIIVVDPSEATRDIWKKTDFLLSEHLLSTDCPSKNLAMMKQTPPRWEDVLSQGAPYSHNIETLKRAEQITTARERLLGESHPLAIHSKYRLAWTSFYVLEGNPSEHFDKLLQLASANSDINRREIASCHAGIGWTECGSENFEASMEKFKEAIEIQSDRVDPEAFSYSIGLAKVELQKIVTELESAPKRRREDEALPGRRAIAEQALAQLHLGCNRQRLHPELGNEHPETASTIALLAWAHEVIARILRVEKAEEKTLDPYNESAELYYGEALKIARKTLGDDHPQTLHALHEVANWDLKKGRTVDGILKLERVLVQERYVLGDDDPNTLATIDLLKKAYKDSGETNKVKGLTVKTGTGPSRKRRRLR